MAGTMGGNYDGAGTVFRLAVGLHPFVETKPSFGNQGATVIILGTNLTGATKVSFNGTSATYRVFSSSEIKTLVPGRAKTGTVLVTTPRGTLRSNLIFKVTPQVTAFRPISGSVGTSVTITGTELTQTSSITFGGVKAAIFAVKSDSEVMAEVPTRAKTGKIAITTAGGTATTSETFTVTP
jgi:IPT/TIG domain-containing protein